MALKHVAPESYSNRSGAPVAAWLALVFALYVVTRLASIHVGLIIIFPFLWFAGYLVFGAAVLFLAVYSSAVAWHTPI